MRILNKEHTQRETQTRISLRKHRVNLGATGMSVDGATYSNIFYFHTYLRAQPIVLRQRLADDGIVVTGGAEQLLHMTRMMERRVTVAERRLYFKTAQTHLKRGCALLSLDVLCRLPRHLCFSLPNAAALPAEAPVPKVSITVNAALSVNAKADSFDWGAPLATDMPSKRPAGSFSLSWGKNVLKNPSPENIDFRANCY